VRILLVDEDPTWREALRAGLEKLGYEPLEFDDGEAAWAVHREQPADVVIAGRDMPGLDGRELARRIREQEGDTYTYVILLTNLADRSEVLRGMEAGADSYLTKPVDPFDLQTALIAAQRVTSLHRQLARYRVELERLNADLAELARTDSLTRLGNRLRLDEDLTELHWRSARYGWSYCLAICDLDRFKEYNDLHGHLAGDEALRNTAAAIAGATRRGDAVYRYGGEEFVLVLPEQTLDGAVVAVERVRAAVEARGPLTISAGVAAFRPDADEAGEDVLARADAALYRAKDEGRNRVAR
jgi:two-component system chemotaxis response regulator CheY